MFVVGHRILKLRVDAYNMSPTAWSVDYVNQVLVGSQLTRVQSPCLVGHLLPHYSRRARNWSVEERDIKAAELTSASLVEVDAARAAHENYVAALGWLSA